MTSRRAVGYRDDRSAGSSVLAPSGDSCFSPAYQGSLQTDLIDRAARLRVPLVAHIELTARCNLRCIHCYVSPRGGVQEHAPELTTPRLLRLMEELAAAGCMVVVLTGGELALRDGWLDVVASARRNRMLVTLLTNGTLLTPDDAARLAELRVKEIAVSLYGDTAALHDEITVVPGSFDKTVAAVRVLRDAGVKVRIATVLMKANSHRFAEIYALADELGCACRYEHTVRPRSDGGLEPLEHRVDAAETRTLFTDPLIGPRTGEGKWAQVHGRVPTRQITNCKAGFTSVAIDAVGGVWACPGLPPKFGSIGSGDFSSTWHGEVAEGFRASMATPLSGCSGCELAHYCLSRCPRLALVEDGDLCGPSSRACNLAGVVRDMCNDYDESLAGPLASAASSA